MDDIDIIKKTNISHSKIKNKIIEIDNKFKNKVFDKNKYFRYLKNVDKSNITKNCYVSMIIISSSYIPALLNLGYALKNIMKTKYNTVCIIQDKPYYEKDINGNNFIKFQALNNEEIENIKKIYDVVIGVDILRLNLEKKNDIYYINYKNLLYYCTRSYILGLTQYEKIIYFDASLYVTSSTDYLFDVYNESTYSVVFYLNLNRGLNGNFIFIKPKPYYFEKSIYLINNYTNIFNEKNNYYTYFTYDEDIMYYSIYPYWNKNSISNDLFYNLITNPNYQIEEKKRHVYHVMKNGKLKPFRYPLMYHIYERNMFNNDCYNYKFWDDGVNLLIKSFPECKKYFEYIKTYRYNNFTF